MIETTADPAATIQPASDAPEAGPVDRDAVIAEIASGVAEIARRKACLGARQLMQDGVSIAHLHVLWLLEDRTSMSMGRLAEMLGVGVPNATGLIDRMEQRGLVVRDRDDEDRRVVHVRCTEAGKALLVDVDGWRSGMISSLLTRVETDQLLRIATGVREMQNAIAAAMAVPGHSHAAAAPPERLPGRS